MKRSILLSALLCLLSISIPMNAQTSAKAGAAQGQIMGKVAMADFDTCATPANLHAMTVSSTTADLMWDAYEMALSHHLKVSTTALANPATDSGDVFDQPVFYKPYQVTGLTPSTNYFFYVSTDCGNGESSNWSAAGTFRTACASVTVPMTETFETSSSLLNCWTKGFLTNGDWSGATASASNYEPATNNTAHAGTASMSLRGYATTTANGPRTTMAWIASPELNVADIRTLQVTFWARTDNANGHLHVGVLADPNDGGTFDRIADLTFSATNSWQQFTIPLNTASLNGAKYVAFMADGSDYSANVYYFVDDVTIDVAPDCPTALQVNATRVTDQTAQINWLGAANSWNIKVSTTALTNPATETADVLNTNVTSSPYTLTGLTARTTYYVYLQAVCNAAGDSLGAWSTSINFTTTQVPVVPTYMCSFDDPAQNNQWEMFNGTNGWYIGTANDANNGANLGALYISSNNGANNTFNASATSYSWAIRTVHFDVGIYDLSFDWICYGDGNWDNLRAFLVPTDVTFNGGSTTADAQGMNGSTNTTPNRWIDIPGKVLNNATTWQHVEQTYTFTTPVDYNLVFFWKNDNSGGSVPAAVDNVNIIRQTCATPSDIHAVPGYTQLTSIRMAWTPSILGETAWDVQVLLDTIMVIDTTINSLPFNATGLQPTQNYTVRVRSNCGNGDVSAWAEEILPTACGDITTLPYNETFRAVSAVNRHFPTCWTNLTTYNAYADTPSSDGDGHSLYFAGAVCTPSFNVPGKRVSDFSVKFSLTPSFTSAVGGYMVIGVATSADATTVQYVDTVTYPDYGTWADYKVNLTNYQDFGTYIVFVPTGYVWLDNVSIDQRDMCPPVTNVTVSNIGTSTAHIAWDAETDITNSWDVTYGPHGFDVATATNIQTVSTTECNLSGLAHSTDYDVYVRTHCGSAWTKAEFTTLLLPNPIPFTSNFEASETVTNYWKHTNNAGANYWTVGTDANNGGTQGFYITNDGTTNGYANTSLSRAYGYVSLAFTAGEHTISYDWKGANYGNAGYVRAALAPKTTDFSTVSTVSAFGVPAGWIAVDNGNTVTNGDWNTTTSTVTFYAPDTMLLVYYWYNDANGGSAVAGVVDNVSVIRSSGCIDAGNLNANTDINGNTTITWAASDPGASYHVVISTASSSNPGSITNAVVDTTVTNNNITVQLGSSTQYYIYVQTTCSGSSTDWNSLSYLTPCSAVQSFVEDFQSCSYTVTLPNCWYSYAASSYAKPKATYNDNANSHNSTCALRFYGAESYAASGAISRPLSETKVGFWLIQEDNTYGSPGKIVVGYLTDQEDFSTFVPVDTVECTTPNTYQYFEVNFGRFANLTVPFYLGFRNFDASSGYSHIDDIEVSEYRQCNTPSDISVSNLTTTGANISWSTNNGLSFDILITTALVDPNTATENDADVYLYETSYIGNSLDLTGSLDPATVYYVYLKADCQSADSKPSFWSEPFRFATQCNAKTVPYTETFASPVAGADIQPLCWNVFNEVNGTVSATLPYISDARASDSDGKSLYMNAIYQSSSANVKSVAALPSFTNSISSLMMTFSVRGEANNRRLLVGVLTDPTDASTFVCVDTIALTTSWRRKIVDFTGVTATGNIAFIADGTLDNNTVAVNIDSINLDFVHGCLIPKSITTANITSESVDITVETNTTLDNMVRIMVSTVNSTTPATLTNLVADTTVNVANLPVTINGLSPVSTYYVYAAVDCGNGVYSDYYDQTVSFTTACGRYNLPFSENFNGCTSGQLPPCWARLNHATYPRAYTTKRVGGTGFSLQMNNTGIGILPEMNIQDMSRVQMQIKCVNGTRNANYNVYVGVMTDPTDASTFVPVDTVVAPYNSGNTFTTRDIDFSHYNGPVGQIAFKASNTLYIDDISISEILPCAAPTNFSTNNVTEQSVDLTWTANANVPTATYQIVYAAAGNDAMQNTPVDLAAGTTTYAVSGLTDNTVYNFYIRSICSAGDTSAWQTVSATTLAGVQRIPFTIDFEDATNNTNWQFFASTSNEGTANNFVIGNATNNGGSSALYVTNDGGNTNAYNNGDETAIFAAYPFHIDAANTLLISFDYKVVGEAGYDYGRVFVAPQTTNFTAYDFYDLDPSSTQAGWVNADNGTNLQQQSSWTTFNGSAALTAGDYFLVMAWRNDGSVGNNPPIAYDNIVVREKTCYAENVTAAAGATSATIQVSTDCPTVHLKVLDGTTATIDTVTSVPFIANNLTPNTNYTVQVVGFCTSGDSTAMATGSFKTLCADIFVDAQNHYFDDFQSYTSGATGDMGCWLRGKSSSGTLPYVSTSYNTQSAYMYSYSSSVYGYIATPNVTGTAINNLRVNFKGYFNYTTYGVAVGIMTDPEDINTFVVIDTVRPTTTGWSNFHVDFDQYAGTGRSIAFRTIGNTAYIDEVEILPIPSCLEADFTLTPSVGTINIEIEPANATDTQWDVVVTTDVNNADASAEVYNQTVTNTNITVSGLQNVTTYYVFVRTRCSAAEQSGWTIKSATTPCGIETLPYAENFSVNGTATLNTCWNRYSGLIGGTLSNTTSGWSTNAGNNGIVGPHMKYNIYSTNKYWLVTPTIAIDSTAALSFDLARTGWNNGNAYTTASTDDRFLVIVSTDGGNTWSESNTIAEWNSTSTTRDINSLPNTAERETISLNAYVGQNIRIAFYGESTTSGTDYDLHIGNINIDYVGAPTTVTVDLTEQVCAGVAYTNYGFNVTEATAGTYTYTRTTTAGDTTYNLTLTVLPAATGSETASVCASALPYLWNGQTLTAAGTYTHTTTAANGCDSVVTLTLTVNEAMEGYDIQTVCENDLPYVWNGQSYNAPGTYTFNTTAANGCDSIATLYLMVAVSDTTYETMSICQGSSYAWNGQTLTTAGEYTAVTGTSTYGCPIVSVLTLTVTPGFTTNDTITVCDTDLPYAWNGQDLTAAGTYTFNGSSQAGCDSVVTLTFVVSNSYAGTETLELLDTQLPYTWNGIDIEAAGEYTYNGTTADGCDSVITLTVNVTVGLEYAENGMFNITPNPVERGGNVRIDASVNENSVVEVFTSNGKLISRAEYGVENIYVTMPQVAGLYMVRLTTASGRIMYGKVIVK
ncbi:MAG: fibronectin type III domain-containing protein [Paludibacteraceae bacterium]|nr:fibronectin type III domain-containing protein [Paludibacteraceae bacterium]